VGEKVGVYCVLTAMIYCCAEQGGTSALEADEDASPASPGSDSSAVLGGHGFVALAVVCALNTFAIVVVLACWVRRRQRMRADDVISVASDLTPESHSVQ